MIKNNQKWNKNSFGYYWKVNEGIKALEAKFPKGKRSLKVSKISWRQSLDDKDEVIM